MPAGDWEKANNRPWPYGVARVESEAGQAPVWPDDYPPSCNCNPPEHTPEQITGDGSFHSRSCPEHPGKRS